jgi:integrase/recombinase XerC
VLRLAERGVEASGNAREFLDPAVVHLVPEEAVFESMLVGFDRQQASRNLKRDTRRSRERLVRQLVAFSGSWPWEWTAADFEHWSAVHLERGRTAATVRGYQLAVAAFLRFAADPRYRWPAVCEARFGAFPVEVVHDLNVVRHTTDYEGSPESNRPLTAAETRRFFEVANGRAAEATRLGRKGALAAHRDAAMFLAILGWGTRRTETSWLEVGDFRHNAKAPVFGRYGQLVVRRGKSAHGSPPRRRVVVTVWRWSSIAMEHYVEEVRPRFFGRHEDTGALFPTERGRRISPRQIDERFASIRDEAGLDRSLDPHCLRHSYVTALIEAGWPIELVRQQAGHRHVATTGVYTALSDDFKDRMIYRTLLAAFATSEGAAR